MMVYEERSWDIRTVADFDRMDLSRSERRWKHRKLKLENRADARREAEEDYEPE